MDWCAILAAIFAFATLVAAIIAAAQALGKADVLHGLAECAEQLQQALEERDALLAAQEAARGGGPDQPRWYQRLLFWR